MRECNRCGCEYEDYGQRSCMCRPCKRIYDREFYHKKTEQQKEKKIALQKELVQEKVKWVQGIKESKGCCDCGITDFRVLDFDHLPQFTKESNVSDLVMKSYSRERIEKEITKCEVVCANCHRIRTYNRRKTMKSDLINVKTITITQEMYDALKDSAAFLECLMAAGVDSWEGYEAAQAMLEQD